MKLHPLFGALAVFALASPRPLQAQNLLSNNPGFESGAAAGGFNGPITGVQGWSATNYRYSWCGITSGGATEGSRKFQMTFGGFLETAAADRPSVASGIVYDFAFDVQTYADSHPELWLGVTPSIGFFDASGAEIKRDRGLMNGAEAQANGVFPWATFHLRAVAPAGAVTASVKVDVPSGGYPNEDTRSAYFDNFHLSKVAEPSDQMGSRIFPSMVEPGKTAHLVLKAAVQGSRDVLIRLVRGTSSYGTVRHSVSEGRGIFNVDYPVPSTAPVANDYSWQFQIVPVGGAWGTFSFSKTLGPIFLDQTQTGAGTIAANSANLVFMGRTKSSGANRTLYWYGSEMRARFSGTSLALNYSTSGNGFGGYQDSTISVIVDGNEAAVTTFTLNGANKTTSLVSGLPDGVHTLKLFKSDESASSALTIQAVVLDSGRGLLRPEPIPSARHIEFFGDSVTSGGSASPNYFGYAPLLARTLNADAHIISKGGTGVSASFSGMVTLPKYWNLLDFRNAFDTTGATPWDFTQWTPDAVVIAIGHNDQFNGGASHFAADYATFVAGVRKVYPNAQIFCCNTIISAPDPHFQSAIEPLLPTDSKVHFLFQRKSWTDPNTGHPPTAGHAAMVNGDADRESMATWIEDVMGWGTVGAIYH